MPRSSRATLAVLVLHATLAASAAAQTTGTIRGEISDPSGAPLPGVTVTVTSEARGTSRIDVSGASGHYVLSGLPVDSYEVKASLESFRRKVQLDIHYLRNWSIWQDLKILWMTISVVITGKGAC